MYRTSKLINVCILTVFFAFDLPELVFNFPSPKNVRNNGNLLTNYWTIYVTLHVSSKGKDGMDVFTFEITKSFTVVWKYINMKNMKHENHCTRQQNWHILKLKYVLLLNWVCFIVFFLLRSILSWTLFSFGQPSFLVLFYYHLMLRPVIFPALSTKLMTHKAKIYAGQRQVQV